MDSLDIQILSFLSDRSRWEDYHRVVDKNLCTRTSWVLVEAFAKYYEENENATEIGTDFELWFRLNGGLSLDDQEMYGTVLKTVRDSAPPSTEFVETLNTAKAKAKIKHLTDDLEAGRISLQEYRQEVFHAQDTVDEEFNELTLLDIANEAKTSGGLYWRLEDLNRAVGPIRQGDLVIVGKRPETGGTSFMCSEATFMFKQMDKDIIIFNNEEAPSKLVTRLMSCALGVDYRTLLSDPAKYQAQYEEWLDGRKIRLVHKTDMTIHDVARYLKQGDYGFVGINVILKIGVPGKMEDYDKLQHAGTFLRGVASQYCPVMAIHQADPSADGQKWIMQNQLYKSKTAIQGEADVLLMIGLDYDEPADSRWLHVAKNKLPPAACTVSNMKHARVEVKFDMDTGRFTSKLFKGAHSCPKH